MKKLLTFLCALCALLLIPNAIKAVDYTIGNGSTTYSNQVNQLPIAIGPMMSYSFTQQLYLASELTAVDATAGSIEAISFIYEGSGTNVSLSNATRTIEVWMRNVTISSFSSNYGYGKSSTDKSAGTLCFSGFVTIPNTAHESYTITLDTPFDWDGTSNIIVTINDQTGSVAQNYARYHKTFSASNRGVHATGAPSAYNASDAWDISITKESYIPVITFSFAEASSVPAPTSPSATPSRFSAVLNWTAAEGADSYEVRYGTTSGSLGDASNVGNVTSHELSGLQESTTYYYQIRTKKGSEYSAWTTEASFTTLNHTHNAITFSKWNFTSTLPVSAGNYYLAHDVTLTSNWEPAGNINLCLNGHTVSMGSNYGLIDDDITVAIYDEEGGGKITSSNNNQTLLASGSFTNLFIYAEIENTGSGRKVKAQSGAIASIDEPIALSEEVDNASAFAENEGLIVNASFTRSLTASQFNTFCLPFTLSNAQLEDIFGAGYDLEEFVSSSFDGEALNLEFNKVTSLEAGKPYLLQPSQNVVNPTFEGVIIEAEVPDDQTSDPYISFHGTFKPTELAGGNKNLLFLGAGNELFWPETTGNLKGFRAYFEVKGAAQKATRARISKKEDHTTDIGDVRSENANAVRSEKILQNGQILIKRDGKTYNVLGSQIR